MASRYSGRRVGNERHPAGSAAATDQWQGGDARFWLPSAANETLWNGGGDPAAETVPAAANSTTAASAVDFVTWEEVIQKAHSTAGTVKLTLAPWGLMRGALADGEDLRLLTGIGVNWADDGFAADDASGAALAENASLFDSNAERKIFGNSALLNLAAAFASLEVGDDADGGLRGVRFRGADLLSFVGDLVPISTADGIPGAASPSGATFYSIAPFSFTWNGTFNLDNPAGAVPLSNAVAGSTLSSHVPDVNSLPATLTPPDDVREAPPVKFHTSRVKSYDEYAAGSAGVAIVTSTRPGAANNGNAGVLGGSTGSITNSPISSYTPTAGGATFSAAGSGSSTSSATYVSAASLSVSSATTAPSVTPSFRVSAAPLNDSTVTTNALVTSIVTTSSAPSVVTASTANLVSAPSSTTNSAPTSRITSQGASPNVGGSTQVLLASLGEGDSLVAIPSANSVSTISSSLNNPQGLAFSLSGNLYVANSGGNSIVQFTLASNGLSSTSQTTFYSGAGVNGPTGLAVDSSGNLYVSNQPVSATPTYTIEKITTGGVATTFSNSSSLNEPGGMAFDSSGNLYVANAGSNTVLKITPGGTVSTFITAGAGLTAPTGLAFDSLGNLYVSYNESGIVEKYSSTGADEGAFVSEFFLDEPVGLAFNNSGQLFLANDGLGEIEEFSAAGVDMGTYASGLNDPGYLAFATVTVPEPGSTWMLLGGAVGLGLARRRRPSRSPARA